MSLLSYIMAIDEADVWEEKARTLVYDPNKSRAENSFEIAERFGVSEATALAYLNAHQFGAVSYGEVAEYYRKRTKGESFQKFIERRDKERFYNGTIVRDARIDFDSLEHPSHFHDQEITQQELLEVLLDDLDPRERLVVEMKYVHNKSRDEVAAAIKRSKAMTDVISARALRKMRKNANALGFRRPPSIV
jgi:RNA polymerase sigma factor (sigma-70 family)